MLQNDMIPLMVFFQLDKRHGLLEECFKVFIETQYVYDCLEFTIHVKTEIIKHFDFVLIKFTFSWLNILFKNVKDIK